MEAPPQHILQQLRTSSDEQRAELRRFVPEDDLFDDRILQVSLQISARIPAYEHCLFLICYLFTLMKVRETMLELIVEIGDCLKQS